MLSEVELKKISAEIPAKTHYAVIASWSDREETMEDWADWEHVYFCNDWVSACNAKRFIEADVPDLVAYIIEPEGIVEDEE